MSTISTTLAMLALGTGLATAPALHAQDMSAGSAAPQMPGMMGGGGTTGGGGMSGGDMESMMKMMQDCTRMMQSMTNEAPQNPSAPPVTPGQRG